MYVGGYAPALLILTIQNIAGLIRPNEDQALIQQRRLRSAAINQELGLVRRPAWWKRINGDTNTLSMRDRIMRNVREVGGGHPTLRNVEAAAATRAREIKAIAVAAPIEMNEMKRTNSISSSIRTNGQRPPPPYTPYSGRSNARSSDRAVQLAAGLLFPSASPIVESLNGSVPANAISGRSSQHRPGTNERNRSTTSGASLTAQPQQIKSMLDV
ncbi:hypothetical protein TruAng_007561 [Truncatella angustata]|nr:hypothetical protein TruAng_007561 [Truncatella angustata]